MRVIWARQPVAAADIIAELRARDATWHPVTAKTLLNRMVKKGTIAATAQGRRYLYRARLDETACINAACRSFLERVFDGSLRRMSDHLGRAGLVRSGRLVPESAPAGLGDPGNSKRVRPPRKSGAAPGSGR